MLEWDKEEEKHPVARDIFFWAAVSLESQI
jgi:hypothetical protein